MRHYEIVFLVHPDKSAEVPKMIKQYKSTIESANGKVHRLENWGLRHLAYPINKTNKAHYVLMNIECTADARKEITDTFHFSDVVLRNLILSREQPILEPSPIKRMMEEAEERRKATKLKQSEEQNLAADSDSSDLAATKSEPNTTAKANTADQGTEEAIARPSEDLEPSAHDTQQSKTDTINIGDNDGETTDEKTKPADTTKE